MELASVKVALAAEERAKVAQSRLVESTRLKLDEAKKAAKKTRARQFWL